MTLTKRQVRKVCEEAGYEVVDITQNRHFHVTVSHGGRTAMVVLSVSPRSQSFWHKWLLADLKRAFRRYEENETTSAEQDV